MGMYFRKVFKFGPARVSVSSRGVGFSIGGEKTRIGVDALGRPYAATGIAGVYLRSAADGKALAAHSPPDRPGGGPAVVLPASGITAPIGVGGILFQGGGKTIYRRFPAASRAAIIFFAALISAAGYVPLALLFVYTLARGGPSVPLGFAAAASLFAGAGLFALQSGVIILDGPPDPWLSVIRQALPAGAPAPGAAPFF